MVRINEGPFANFQATVEEYDVDKGMLKLNVLIFGRPTPTEIEYAKVRKIEE
jgi:transcriptional antiterminator NusG